MTGFIVRRLLSSVLVVVLTSLFVFTLFFKGMGTAPAVNYCEKLGPGRCTPAKLASIEQAMGLRQVARRELHGVGQGALRGPRPRVGRRQEL